MITKEMPSRYVSPLLDPQSTVVTADIIRGLAVFGLPASELRKKNLPTTLRNFVSRMNKGEINNIMAIFAKDDSNKEHSRFILSSPLEYE